MIIGVSAKKQGGKSTFIDVLKGQIQDPKIIRFADKLKEVVLDCFVPSCWHWTIDDLDSDAKKNLILPCGKTVRYMLQVVGTDWFRHTWESCWINAYGSAVTDLEEGSKEESEPIILTPDVRFPNELCYIHKHGGRVLRLTRAPFFTDTHESETALDPAMWATILHWNEMGVEASIQRALSENIPWVVDLLQTEEPNLIDLNLKWRYYPELFDEVVDNRNRTEEEQRQWVKNWWMDQRKDRTE